jgi:hypothetical protein
MSARDAGPWELSILDFSGHTPVPPAAWRGARAPRAMGGVDRVRGEIDGALADVVWSSPTAGTLDAGQASLEFDLGGEPTGFVLRARGTRRAAAALIAHLCLVNGWAALDRAAGTFLDLDELAADPDA